MQNKVFLIKDHKRNNSLVEKSFYKKMLTFCLQNQKLKNDKIPIFQRMAIENFYSKVSKS